MVAKSWLRDLMAASLMLGLVSTVATVSLGTISGRELASCFDAQYAILPSAVRLDSLDLELVSLQPSMSIGKMLLTPKPESRVMAWLRTCVERSLSSSTESPNSLIRLGRMPGNFGSKTLPKYSCG